MIFLGPEEKTDHTPEDTGTGTSVPADGAPASVNTDRDDEDKAGDNQGKFLYKEIYCIVPVGTVPTVGRYLWYGTGTVPTFLTYY